MARCSLQDTWKVDSQPDLEPRPALGCCPAVERQLRPADDAGSGSAVHQVPRFPAGNLVPGDPGVPSTISPTQYNNFGPRIGIAYAPSGGIWGENKTSIRAAYGVYYLGAADNGNFGIHR